MPTVRWRGLAGAGVLIWLTLLTYGCKDAADVLFSGSLDSPLTDTLVEDRELVLPLEMDPTTESAELPDILDGEASEFGVTPEPRPQVGSEELFPDVSEEGPSHLSVQFSSELVMSGLEFPIGWAPTSDGRLFFTEGYTGRVRAVADWAVVDGSVLELPDALGFWEQGLLGLAAHPDFSQNPYLYLYYTATRQTDDGEQAVNRLVRFSVAGSGAPEVEALVDDLPADWYHNGGIVVFGPDGKLYVSVGDGHDSDSAQDLALPSGKVLRLNPDGTVPEDNPFPDSPVYALGFRNVFGMAFDPETGNLWVTENGPDCCDEVNLVRPGQNYGWPRVLGRSEDGVYWDPVLVFESSIAPTQAVFYHGERLPLGNDLLFGDFIRGELHRLSLGGEERDGIALHEAILRTGAPIIGVFVGADEDVYFSTPSELFRLTVSPGL